MEEYEVKITGIEEKEAEIIADFIVSFLFPQSESDPCNLNYDLDYR